MSEIFTIRGLAGERTLAGTVKVGGAKNAVLKAMAASVLFRDEAHLTNVPNIEDVHRLAELLTAMGAEVEYGEGSVRIWPKESMTTELPREISGKFRGSIVAIGPVLARFGKVTFPHPGGCLIGKRPIDLFLEGFEKMGATMRDTEKAYEFTAPPEGLHGAELFFDKVSVTATETFMMAAVLAKGTTTIKNAAMEPEIPLLAEYLNECGAHITGAGTSTITIEGGELLHGAGKTYETPPDRIEAGSFAILAALAARDVTIEDCEPAHMDAVLDALRRTGVSVEVGNRSVRITGDESTKLTAVDIKTHEYPGFVTDLQQPFTVLLTQAEGESVVFETIFESRLGYTEQLATMGANIKLWDAHRAEVKGPTPLKGRVLESPDLRAGLAFVIAAIVARGESKIHNVYNIDRGYEKIEERLRSIGVDIVRSDV